MADVVASGILNSVLDRLTGRMVEKFGWLTDVGAELKKLEGTLSTIRDVLEDAEARQVKEKALTGWLRRLKDMAYDIDDLLDEDFAKNRKRSAPESSTSWMKGKVSSLLSLPNSIMSQRKIVREIREIRERLDQLADDRSKFHLEERSVVIMGREENVMRETGSFVIESEVYGREEDKKKIIEFLVDSSGGDLGVIAIVGMGGVGKTTLAQLVYNDQQIKDNFEEKMKIWVCVSDDFDHTRLVGSIIEQTTGSRPCNLTSMALMESKLKEALEKKKKFLLVLDDVWNENYEKWDRLRCLLTIGATGSRVIVTTRDGRIASQMATVEPHLLKGLSEDHCWLLFEKIAFGRGGCEKTSDLVIIGKEIVKKCGGVPLAAKVLGSLMRFKKWKSEWLVVRDYDSWKSEENDHILPALRLSYNHLPSHLKQCFSYCSIFPKDTEIKEATLVELWIAEGFIRRPNKNVKLEDVGHQYLRELLSRSLFEKDYPWNTSIKMHDLVHDLAQSISGEECLSINIAGNRSDIYPTIITRYSSFTYTKEATPLILDILTEAKKLRTFYFLKSGPHVQIRNEDMMQKILETVFSSMKLLRALHLKYCYPIKELPMSISNLRHLRYLNLSWTGLETLPHSIGNLQNLQFLILHFCESLKELPDSIGNLSNLSTLNLKSCKSFVSLPTSIGNLSDLSTLNLGSCESFVSLPDSIGNLSNLSTLNLGSCKSFVSLPDSIIGNLSNLSTLNLRSCESFVSLPDSIGNLSNLSTLNLKSCESLVSLPDSTGNLSNLSTLNLESCKSLVSLPDSIGNLSNLSTLNLGFCKSFVSLPDSIGNLSNLSTLNLEYCESLVSLPDSIGNLSNLSTLNLESCKSLVSLPTSIGHLKSLQTLNLGFTKIEKLPESLCCLSDLRSINLCGCESLLELPENMKDMKSLTNLDTGECDKLTGMPSGIGQLSHLRGLSNFVVSEKRECGLRELNGLNLLEGCLHIPNLENVKNFQQARDANLIEKHDLNELKLSWGLDTYKRQVEADQEGESRQDLIRALALAEKVLEGLQPHPNLTALRINSYLGKIFPKWLESSSSLPNLDYLRLIYCFRCETLPEISQLHNLRSLTLWKLPAVQSIPPLGQLPHLEWLALGYLLSVKSLGSEFYGTGDGAFPVLEELSLEYMPELEEWCEASTAGQRSFPHLDTLSLKNCPKLKVLPSSLPSLRILFLGADYELLVSSIPRGAFPNLKDVFLPNFDESNSPVPQIVAERLTFQSCRRGHSIKPLDADELNFMRSVAGLP